MKRICTVVGVRLQFVKAAVVSKALEREGIREALLHTGQHNHRALSAEVACDPQGSEPIISRITGCGPHDWQLGAVTESPTEVARENRFPDSCANASDVRPSLTFYWHRGGSITIMLTQSVPLTGV